MLERKILKLLDAGCHEPVGVYSRIREKKSKYLESAGGQRNRKRVYLTGGIGELDLLGRTRGERTEIEMKETGKVFLVGAGPGDPGLMTEKGLKRLQECDAVVYDHLASERFLMRCRKRAKRSTWEKRRAVTI